MTYGLRPDYISRPKPAYFEDTLPDSHLWQGDVYRLAATLARKSGVKRLVDIGCGRGAKLAPYVNEFDIIGVDYGANIDACKRMYPKGQWVAADLEINPIDGFPDSVVICADVVEHLAKPDALIETLRSACQKAAYVIISTPDRVRLYGYEQNGPPANPHHVREWTQAEFESWLIAEGLPVRWSGWTVSHDSRLNQPNTTLVVLAQSETALDLPAAFEPAPRWGKVAVPVPTGKRLRVWMTPTPFEASRDSSNSIHNIVLRLNKHLGAYDVELIEHPDNADLRVGHAGQGSSASIDVAHYHGLYPTAMGMDSGNFFAINAQVIRNLRNALSITAPSQWIADVIRRDMHIEPHIVPWGVDSDEWTPAGEHMGYVLWNKARIDPVCDPSIMQALAAKVPNVPFVSTFGNQGLNVKIIGRQRYEVMKTYVRGARVYLNTTTETFGVGVLEAASSGVPILAIRHGAVADYIQHGVHGFLAEPGDMDGLVEGLHYCIKYRDILGANARELAKTFTWDKLAERMAGIYRDTLRMKQDVRSHKIAPALYQVAI